MIAINLFCTMSPVNNAIFRFSVEQFFQQTAKPAFLRFSSSLEVFPDLFNEVSELALILFHAYLFFHFNNSS